MPGRKPLPSAVHKQSGAYALNPQRENHAEPQPPEGLPDMPSYLADYPLAANKWQATCAMLQQMRILSKADLDVLEQHCMVYQRWRELITAVPFKETPAIHKYQTQLLKTTAELGLTPSARSRLKVTDNQDDHDPFSDYLRNLRN